MERFSFEHFEHTADLGLRVHSTDLGGLFEGAAACLFAAIVEDIAAIRPNLSFDVAISGSDREFLLFDWLRALLQKSDEDKLVFGEFAVTMTVDGLQGTARGEPLDPTQHAISREVKAITYHELIVAQEDGQWLAEVIVDI